MSAFGMKPTFTDYQGYKEWINGWKLLYQDVSDQNLKRKLAIKAAQRKGVAGEEMSKMRAAMAQDSAMATKALTLLSEAKIRWENIKGIRKGIREQHATFPIVIEDVRNMDFHFNKKHLEFPEIVPMWIVKAKGQTFYVNHVDCSTPWTTREQPDNPSTKGAIRIKRGTLSIDANANATIS